MAGEVGYKYVEGFHAFAAGMAEVRDTFTALGREPHTPADLHLGGGGAWPLADVGLQVEQLAKENEAAIGRVAAYATAFTRRLSGLAFISARVGTQYPATDSASKERIQSLVDKAAAAVPAPAATLPGTDPRFQPPPVAPSTTPGTGKPA